MLFNSNIFLFAFLPIALIGYYVLAHRFSVFSAKVWLCLASFVFYGWWNPLFLLLLWGSIAFNYTISVYLKDTDSDPGRVQGLLFATGIIGNLLLLFYYKYLFPLLDFLHHVGWWPADMGSVILPIGISFFTFTQIGYLVDCRQGLVKERGFVNYVLFVTFFPHLIAGPILHHREIMPQFASDSTYRFKWDNLAAGFSLFSMGLLKKVLIADSLSGWAETGFGHLAGMPAILSWSVAIAYSMQLYFDFSGYSDMAIALGILFGVRLPLNFNSPYKSSSVIEFWQRWHMTLTRYLTLLLYNPISLRVARWRQAKGLASGRVAAATPFGFSTMIVMPTMITMLLAGIWHGAGLQFIIYGLLFGLYLSVNHGWRIIFPENRKSKVPEYLLVRVWTSFWPVALTYLCVLVGQIFFRSSSVADACALLAGMLGFHGSGLPLPLPVNDVNYLGATVRLFLDHHVFVVGTRDAYNALTLPLIRNLLMAFGAALIAFWAPNVYQIMGANSPALTKVKPEIRPSLQWRPRLAWALGCGLLFFWSSLQFSHAARFLYFQF